VTHNRSF